jgi:hypothetical protein
MGKSSAPEPTPPKETAAAQTGQNVTTAIAQQMMNNVNQTTPYGSLTYNQTGSYQMTDPNSGEVYDIPTWEAIQALSPEQQQLYNSQTQVGQNLAELAVNASGRLDDLLSKPVDYSSVGGMQQYATPPPPVMQPYGSAQSLAEMLQGAGDMQSGFDRSAMQTGVGGSQDYTRGVTAPSYKARSKPTGRRTATSPMRVPFKAAPGSTGSATFPRYRQTSRRDSTRPALAARVISRTMRVCPAFVT